MARGLVWRKNWRVKMEGRSNILGDGIRGMGGKV
jgi:hypothetical protein